MDGITEDVSFLTIPIELRLAIYRFIFYGQTIVLLCDFAFFQKESAEDDVDDHGPGRELALQQMDPYRRRYMNLGALPAMALRPSWTMSILFTCHQTYKEAGNIFYQTAAFHLQSLDERPLGQVNSATISPPFTDVPHETHPPPTLASVTRVSPLPPTSPRPIDYHGRTSQIQRLSIPHSLLSSFPPEKLHSLFPSLGSLTIESITIPLAHQTLSALTPHLYTLHHSTSLSDGSASISAPQAESHSQSPGIFVLQTLLCAMDDEAQMEAIMAHASYASRTSGRTSNASHAAGRRGKYALELQFVLQCRHVGMLIVPGMFPMASAPHRHPERVVTYSFNAGGGGGGLRS